MHYRWELTYATTPGTMPEAIDSETYEFHAPVNLRAATVIAGTLREAWVAVILHVADGRLPIELIRYTRHTIENNSTEVHQEINNE